MNEFIYWFSCCYVLWFIIIYIWLIILREIYVMYRLCGGGWWLVDFTSTTFRFILLLVGGYLTRFLILRDRLWEVYFTFSFWVLDGELFTENYEIEVFKPDNWELIFEDSETTLSLSINDYWGRELFTHYVLNFHRSHLKIGIVIYLLLLLASIHLERFGVQQALYFRERLILLP